MDGKTDIIDLSKQRRSYYRDEWDLKNCPECGDGLINKNCTIFLCTKSDTVAVDFMTNLSGSHFCKRCPVVVFDIDKIELAVKTGLQGGTNLQYIVAGIVDLDAIPDDKKHLEIGCDENPVPLVHFLPDLANQPVVTDKKPQRNAPCDCGSGKKYKKCCGK